MSRDQNIADPNLAKAIELAVNKGGIYDQKVTGGAFPPEARRDLFDKGVVIAATTLAFRSAYLVDKKLSMDNLHVSRDLFYNFYVVFLLRKNVLWKADFDPSIG